MVFYLKPNHTIITDEILVYTRFIFYDEEKDNKYPYIYLCNYNPIEEFDDDDLYKRTLENGTEISTNIQITCQTVTSSYNSIHFDNSELYSYLDLCYFLADFYVCKRFNKPKQYNLDIIYLLFLSLSSFSNSVSQKYFFNSVGIIFTSKYKKEI